jgi:hypothetical protein
VTSLKTINLKSKTVVERELNVQKNSQKGMSLIDAAVVQEYEGNILIYMIKVEI